MTGEAGEKWTDGRLSVAEGGATLASGSGEADGEVAERALEDSSFATMASALSLEPTLKCRLSASTSKCRCLDFSTETLVISAEGHL